MFMSNSYPLEAGSYFLLSFLGLFLYFREKFLKLEKLVTDFIIIKDFKFLKQGGRVDVN